MTCFVTVGTTLFEDLINEVLSQESISCLKSIGVQKVKLQIGKGNFSPTIVESVFKGSNLDEGSGTIENVAIEYYRFKPSLAKDMEEAMLIIGHAGAGTCLEVLKLQKPFIVVINEKLMDNHQTELAVALADGLHLLYCTPRSLADALINPVLFTLIPYIPISQKRVANFINQRMGIVKKD